MPLGAGRVSAHPGWMWTSGQRWRGAALSHPPAAPLWHPLKSGTASLSPLASPSKQVGVFNCFIEICIINILQWTVKLFLESTVLVPGSCHCREEGDSGWVPQCCAQKAVPGGGGLDFSTACDFAAVLGNPIETHRACPRTHVQAVLGSHLT